LNRISQRKSIKPFSNRLLNI
jgi:hypothetical protein